MMKRNKAGTYLLMQCDGPDCKQSIEASSHAELDKKSRAKGWRLSKVPGKPVQHLCEVCAMKRDRGLI